MEKKEKSKPDAQRFGPNGDSLLSSVQVTSLMSTARRSIPER